MPTDELVRLALTAGGVALAVCGLSWLTAIETASPIQSDSGVPTYTVWAMSVVVSLVLLATRRRRWALAWAGGAVLGVVVFVITVFAYFFWSGGS